MYDELESSNRMEVRLIDFANTVYAHELDMEESEIGYMTGLRNVISCLGQFRASISDSVSADGNAAIVLASAIPN